MILTIDIGNTTTSFGLYAEELNITLHASGTCGTIVVTTNVTTREGGA